MKWYHTEVAWDKNGLQVYVPVSEPFKSFEEAEKAKAQFDDEDFFNTFIMRDIDIFKRNCYIVQKFTYMNHKGPYSGHEDIYSRTEMLRKGGATKWFERNYPKQDWNPNMTFYRLYWVTKEGQYICLSER